MSISIDTNVGFVMAFILVLSLSLKNDIRADMNITTFGIDTNAGISINGNTDM